MLVIQKLNWPLWMKCIPQIDADMTKAGELMENMSWTNTSGRVTKGTVVSMHARFCLPWQDIHFKRDRVLYPSL